jgi:hypothetical protein
MRKTHTLTLCFALLFFFIYPLKTKAYHFNSFSFYQKDTGAVAKKAAELAKAKQGFFKKLAGALQFRTNARNKEKERVLNIINGLSIGDSINISADHLKMMIIALSDKQDRHYDSLLAVIDSIKTHLPASNTATKPAEPANSGNKNEPPPVDSSIITDQDIDDLVNKILPLVTGKAISDKQEQEKRQAASNIRKVIDADNPILLRKREGLSIKDIRVTLHKITDLYGFYNALAPFDYSTIKFKLFNWWIYDAILLNGKTGNFKELNGWDSATITDAARQAGCKLAFTLLMDNDKSTTSFLKNTPAQQQLANNIISLVYRKKTDGVNICFRKLTLADKPYFSAFISFLSKALKTAYPGFTIGITIPATSPLQAYDMNALNQSADIFFTEETTTLSYYLDQKVPASKFVFTIPVSATSIDDAATLDLKFNMVKDDSLGGAGICYTGNNINYSTVWETLLYKLVKIDSLVVKDSVITRNKLTFFERISRRLALYNYIICNPCEECFENFDKDSDINKLMLYVHDLRIDSLTKVHNQKIVKDNKDTHNIHNQLLTEFEYVSHELTTILGYLTLFLLLAGIVIAIIYVYYLKNKGNQWPYKKPVAGILIAIVALLTLSFFSYVFVNDTIPFFGVSTEASKEHEEISTVSGVYYKRKTSCIPDGHCVNIPLYTLLGIISLGAGVGTLLARYLILPLLKKDDLP